MSFVYAYIDTDSDTLKSFQSEMKKKADKSYRIGLYYDAISYYQQYFEAGGDDVKLMYRLANLYYDMRDYSMANNYYDSVLNTKPSKFPLSAYYKADVLMNLEKYDEAINYFNEFRRIYRGKKDKDNYRRRAQVKIKNAEWASIQSDSLADVNIIHLSSSINQPHIEFSPFLLDENTMVYGSLKEDNASVTGDNFRKLYLAKGQGNEWAFQKPFDETINKGEFHVGNAVFSPDGMQMYFTRCEKNWQNKIICSIYKSEKLDGEWQEPEKLPYPVNSESYTTTQPALGNNLRKNSEILYFVSDRPGGKGGWDIWYTEPNKRTGEYREPRNLGRTINSYEDEATPFYDQATRTLYFSSKGHHGFGGFDIYKSNGSGNRWTDPTAFPKPINSPFDDNYLITENGTDGYFTSNRAEALDMDNGSCCDDIFYFSYNECIKANITGKVINSTNYDFYDELNERYNLGLEYPEDNQPVGGVSVFVYDVDSTNNEVLVAQTKTKDDGSYKLMLDMHKNYSVIVKNFGFFDRRLRLSTKNIKCADTINLGITAVNKLPEITVRVNVYYEHDKSRLTKEARLTIDTVFMPLFDLFPNAIIEIGSHTDSTGTDEYNIRLSQRRSESVVNYLAGKGVSVDRLVAKGYGESRPIAPNTNPDGSDNPVNRQLNRRTELKVVGEVSSFYIDE
ncbi:MAG: OmpA family protein [Bacteroidales bacterium]|nr:OmpA family protein [Bacteroidales bacterium]MBN2820095.1 OmpA family protein [Bacteroidales bacterium]